MKKADGKDEPMRGEGSAYDELQAMKRSFMRRNQVRAGRRRGRTHDLVILCMVCILHCILHYTAFYTAYSSLVSSWFALLALYPAKCIPELGLCMVCSIVHL